MAESRYPVYPSDRVYQYDGSLEGFYCCVFDSLAGRELPAAIEAIGEAQLRLFKVHEVSTDSDHARRVRGSAAKKISARALELTETVFYSCLEEKELQLLRFLLRGWNEGPGFLQKGFSDAALSRLLQAERHLMGEANLLKGFVRFSDYEGHLAARITPKNFILPFLAGHFVTRFRNESFLIFDQTHKAALIYQNRQARIVAAEHIEFPAVSEEEARYRALWKHFYNTVAIEGRENPRCRMSHMPKRYWENMPEMEGLV
ncbi:MAG: TIGR03915 family putative DNA repair protein [Oscillospiraceae bacterium]|nr:TIGR03915 family putative DNA repair protein [Oscillospiraceae bacterium]